MAEDRGGSQDADGPSLKALKGDFRRRRAVFLRQLVREHADVLRTCGFAGREVGDLARGRVPLGYGIHHWVPLAQGGGNALENLVLMPQFPNHEDLHAMSERLGTVGTGGAGAAPLGLVRHAGAVQASGGASARTDMRPPGQTPAVPAKPVMIAAPPKVAASLKVAKAGRELVSAEKDLVSARASDPKGTLREATRDLSSAKKDLRKASQSARPRQLFERLR